MRRMYAIAMVLLVSVLVRAAETPPEAYVVGLRLMKEGLYSEAAQQFERAHRDAPRSPYATKALFLSAECKREIGWHKAAGEIYEQIAKGRDRENQLARVRLAEYALDEGKASEALKWLEDVAGLSGTQEGFRVYLQGRALAAAGRVEEAERLLQRMADVPGTGEAASLLLGWLLETKGRVAEAQSRYRSVLKRGGERGPYCAVAFVHLADIERRGGRFAEALGLISKARAAGAVLPGREQFLADYVEGTCLLARGDKPDQAARALSKARNALSNLPPDAAGEFSGVLQVLDGAAALSAGDMGTLQKALKGLPEKSEYAVWLGAWSAYLSGDTAAALKMAAEDAKAVKEGVLLEDLRLVRAAAALREGKWEEALEASEADFPARPRELNEVIQAAAAIRLGRTKEAVTALEKIVAGGTAGAFVGWASAALLVLEATGGGEVVPERVAAVMDERDSEKYKPVLQRLLVGAAYRKGEPAELEKVVKELLPTAGGREAEELRVLLAWAQYAQGRKAEAAKTLLTAGAAPSRKYQAALLLAEAGAHEEARRLILEARREGHAIDPTAALYAAQSKAISSDEVFALLEPLLSAGKEAETALRRLFAAAWDRKDWKLLLRGTELALKHTEEGPAKTLARVYRALAEVKDGDADASMVAVSNALPRLGGSDRVLGIYVRGIAALRLGRKEEALSDLLYVGVLSSGTDDAARRFREEALGGAVKAAKELGKQEVVVLAERYLRAAAGGGKQ